MDAGIMTNLVIDIFYILMNVQDNTIFENMVKNRPAASVIPSVNKRLLAQRFARTGFAVTVVGLTASIFLYKFWLNANSGPFLKTKKAYKFEADPYTGKVKCNYREVPNYQHGYWLNHNMT